MRFTIVSFGCKVNQYEGEALREALEAAGWVFGDDLPDAVIINACSVTGAAAAGSRRAAVKAKRENPDAVVVLTGCWGGEIEAAAREAGIDYFVPGRKKADIVRLLLEKAPDGGGSPIVATTGEKPALKVSSFRGHTRAFLKIQDGCSVGCSYCIVPRFRGKPVSKPIADVVAEAREMAANGHREIVLTGIHLGSYGKDLDSGENLAAAVRALEDVDKLDRLRLSSLEPSDFTDELKEALLESSKVCPHFHFPLQSGSDDVLARMGRRYRREDFIELAAGLRAVFADPCLSTDVIVGFPGESEGDFASTCDAAREVGFARMHIFPFSPRPGTRAASFDGRVEDSVMSERKVKLAQIERELAADYFGRFAGKTIDALVLEKGAENGLYTGVTERYLDVRFEGGDELGGRIVPVRIERVDIRVGYGRLDMRP